MKCDQKSHLEEAQFGNSIRTQRNDNECWTKVLTIPRLNQFLMVDKSERLLYLLSNSDSFRSYTNAAEQ